RTCASRVFGPGPDWLGYCPDCRRTDPGRSQWRAGPGHHAAPVPARLDAGTARRATRPPRRRLAKRRLGGGVDAQFAQFAVEGRTADAEAARDFGHAPAIMADGEADDI